MVYEIRANRAAFGEPEAWETLTTETSKSRAVHKARELWDGWGFKNRPRQIATFRMNADGSRTHVINAPYLK